MPTPRINIPMPQLTAFCQKWKIVELSLFGSVLRDDFGPESDVDVFVTFAPDACPTLITFAASERELSELFGRKVDLVQRVAAENETNPFRRAMMTEALAHAEVLYAA